MVAAPSFLFVDQYFTFTAIARTAPLPDLCRLLYMVADTWTCNPLLRLDSDLS